MILTSIIIVLMSKKEYLASLLTGFRIKKNFLIVLHWSIMNGKRNQRDHCFMDFMHIISSWKQMEKTACLFRKKYKVRFLCGRSETNQKLFRPARALGMILDCADISIQEYMM